MTGIIDLTKTLPVTGWRPPLLSKQAIIIHHSGVKKDAEGNIVNNLHNIARYVASRAWFHRGFPYHYIVDREGLIYHTVSDNKFLPHCGNLGYNNRSLAVCSLGHGDSATDIQLSRTAQLIGYLRQKYNKDFEIKGHRDVSDKYTYCPSDRIHGQLHNFRIVKGANTIMEAPYGLNDIISITTAKGVSLNVRDAHSIATGNVIKKLKRGDKVRALGGVQQGIGYTWVDINFEGESLGWIVSKWTKLEKKAEISQAEDAKYHANEIKKHADSIIKLSK